MLAEYVEACAAAGLVANGEETAIGMTAAIAELKSRAQVRFLLVQVLIEGSNGVSFGTGFREMCRDHAPREGLEGSIEKRQQDIARLLQQDGRPNSDFGSPDAALRSHEASLHLETVSNRRPSSPNALFQCSYLSQTCRALTLTASELQQSEPDYGDFYDPIGRSTTLLRAP